MSADIKEQVEKIAGWVIKIVFGVIAWFAVTTFMDVRDSIKNIDGRVNIIGSDVQAIKGRLDLIDYRVNQNDNNIKKVEDKIDANQK